MATNRRFYPAHHLELPVIAGTVSGSPVAVGDLPGVATTDRDSAGNASVALAGAYALSVTASGAIAVGAAIYITTATGALTDAAGAGKILFGHVVEGSAAGAGAVTLTVKISTP